MGETIFQSSEFSFQLPCTVTDLVRIVFNLVCVDTVQLSFKGS